MRANQSVMILEGDHKGESGIVVAVKGENAVEVLTLAGHTHVYRAEWLVRCYPKT